MQKPNLHLLKQLQNKTKTTTSFHWKLRDSNTNTVSAVILCESYNQLDIFFYFILDEMNDHQSTLSYILINPSPDTRLELNDVV